MKTPNTNTLDQAGANGSSTKPEGKSFGSQGAAARRPLAVAVIGCGYWGPNLIRNFALIPTCDLKAVCDLSPTRLDHVRRLFPTVDGFSDHNELLRRDDIDAVVVATPVRYHFPIAKAALLAGKHVLIEKPMASSVEECEELIAIAEKQGRILMIGHTFLYSEPVHKMNQIISSGDLGEICYINSQRLNLGLFQKDINVAWDLAPHDLSIILHILGESPLTVNCQGNAHITKGIEDVTNISLTFPNKRFATIQSSWLEPRKVRAMTIVGTKRMIVYNDVEPLEKIKVYDVRVDRPPHYDSFAEFHYSYHYGDSYIPRLEQREPLREQCQHFLDCIEKGNQPLTSGHSGLELVRILEASSESLRNSGAPVQLGARKAPPLETVGGQGAPCAA
ncbi:Gfo/Idh/MocA family oxidoreductase [soil metagenome]